MLRVAGCFAVLHFALESVSAQNCYYPNGDVSRTDASCSDDGGACCPLDWICLSNGLCWLDDSNDYYGRYTCTDRSCKSCIARTCIEAVLDRKRDHGLIVARGRRLSAILYLEQHGCR